MAERRPLATRHASIAGNVARPRVATAPAVAAAARDLGLAALRREYAKRAAGKEMGAIGSIWMVLAREPSLLAPLGDAGWGTVLVDGITAITDDRPDILRFLFLWEATAPAPGHT